MYTINNQQNISYGSKIHGSNTIGYAVNTAIKTGDKGFFNALKHLASDGLKRDIYISGRNTMNKSYTSATAILRVDNSELSFTTSLGGKSKMDGFELMSKNAIKLIKKLASETGKISKEELSEKSSEKSLLKESNELYKSIFVA